MAITDSTHLILLDHKIKGWNLYKSTVKKGGDLVTQTYKKQIMAGKNVINAQKKVTTQTVNGQKKIKEAVTYTSAAMKKGAGASNDLTKALKRAAIVAPVWLLLRSAMMKTIRTIAEGHKAWAAWDKALIKSKAVIHTTTMSIGDAFVRLQDETEKLSLKTGVSLDKITNAFYRFGTLGIEFEDSLAGMTASMNIALTMGGDLEQVARPLAFAYKLLGDTMDQTQTPMQNMEALGAKMFAIWKINAFEINEFSQSLNNFLPTANTANFALDETVTLLTALSSSAILGARGGRLLRQSVLRLVANLGQLGSQLGIAVNPQMESTNDILLRVLGRIKEIGESGATARAGAALSEIFGGARMGEAARGLISVYDLIEENTKIMTASGEELDKLLEKQTARLKEVENSLSRQLEITKNLDIQLGRVFLKGLFGGKEYAETIKNINNLKRAMLPLIEGVSSSIHDMFTGGRAQGNLYLGILQKIQEAKYKIKTTSMVEEATAGMKFRPEVGRYTGAWTEEEIKAFGAEKQAIERINYENKIKLNLLEEGVKLAKLQALGLSKTQIAEKKLTTEVKERVNQYNNLVDLEEKGYKKITEKQVLMLLETRNYEQLLALTGEALVDQDKLYQLAKMQGEVDKARFKDQSQTMKLLLTHETNLAKLRGASNRQIIESNIAMNAQLGIGQDHLSLLKNQLALEIAIKKEKEAQTKLSSDTMKLYEISQKYGVDIAQDISKFLEGETEYKVFKNIGDAFTVFKSEFANIAKTMQAVEFFKKPEAKRISIKEQIAPETLYEKYKRERDMMTKLREESGLLSANEENRYKILLKTYEIKARTKDLTEKEIERVRELENVLASRAFKKPDTSVLGSIPTKQLEVPKLPTIQVVPPKVDIKTIIESIEINLPKGTLDELKEAIGDELYLKITTDDKYKKGIGKGLFKFITE